MVSIHTAEGSIVDVCVPAVSPLCTLLVCKHSSWVVDVCGVHVDTASLQEYRGERYLCVSLEEYRALRGVDAEPVGRALLEHVSETIYVCEEEDTTSCAGASQSLTLTHVLKGLPVEADTSSEEAEGAADSPLVSSSGSPSTAPTEFMERAHHDVREAPPLSPLDMAHESFFATPDPVCSPTLSCRRPSTTPSGGQGLLLSLTATLCIFHCAEAFIKQYIFESSQFSFTEGLTLLQACAVALCALVDYAWYTMTKPAGEDKTCPVYVYVLLGTFLGVSQISSNLSMLHLDYVLQVVFTSSKLLWIMGARYLFLKSAKPPTMTEWVGAVFIVIGLCVISVASVSDASRSEAKPNASVVKGFAYVMISLICDAGVFTVQEGLAFGTYGAPKQLVIVCMQAFAVLPVVLVLFGSGDVHGSWEFFASEQRFIFFVVCCAVCNFVGAKAVLKIVDVFNGTTAALAMSARKILTIALSMLWYPTGVTYVFMCGSAMVICGANATLFQRQNDGKQKTE